MSEKKPARREAKSTNRSIRIRLSQINVDRNIDYCHRDEDALDPKKLKLLADSLVYEGQQTPMTVCNSGQPDSKGDDIYVLIGGFRRYFALKEAIKQKLDVDRIHNDMEVDAVEVVQGKEQEDVEFKKDLLLRSVTENEQRKNFTTAEKLEIVKSFRDEDVPDPRAASAMSISDTQYGRFVSVVSHSWLHKHVVDNCVGMTDAAELIKLAEKHKWVDEFHKDLDDWIDEHRQVIEQERRELAKIGKKLSGSAEQVKKFIGRNLVKHWVNLVENRKRFDGDVRFKFGIVIDKHKGTITIPGSTLKVTDLSSGDFDTMIGELHDTVDKFLPMMRERRVIEEATSLTEEEKQRELARILEQRKEQQQAEQQANSGQNAEGFGSTETPQPVEVDVDDETENDESTSDDVDVPDHDRLMAEEDTGKAIDEMIDEISDEDSEPGNDSDSTEDSSK